MKKNARIIVISFVILTAMLFIVVAALGSIPALPTLKEGYSTILSEHPECQNTIRIVIEEQPVAPVFGSGPGATAYYLVSYYLICDSADIRLEVRQ